MVAAITRSSYSLKTYGPNVALLLHPDSTILVVQTLYGYLLTYAVASDPTMRVYQQRFDHSSHPRRQQLAHFSAVEESNVVGDISIRFRMAIKIESGIVKALALDQELVVATMKPPAVQCIRWAPEAGGAQTTSEMLSRILDVSKKVSIVDMVYDRAMNLLIWLTNNGQAYAVQRVPGVKDDSEAPKKLFHGHCFHDPKDDAAKAVKVAVNARFSLLTVSCANGEILVYTAKDYMGNIPLSQSLQQPATPATSGALTFMSYSPDGYCLFAGYERGWTTWSVFGKPGGNSFSVDSDLAKSNGEDWLTGVSNGCWIGGGSDIILSGPRDRRLWILETARSALTGCFSAANLARGLLQTGTEFILYRGHDLPDLMTISGKDSLWHHAQYPPAYLHSQWPIRSCVVSQDGRYVAIAGRRGLAHYSVNSGRWKVFEGSKVENSFAVRGGMCWYGHILIAAVESDGSYEVRSLIVRLFYSVTLTRLFRFVFTPVNRRWTITLSCLSNIFPLRWCLLASLEKTRSWSILMTTFYTTISSIPPSLRSPLFLSGKLHSMELYEPRREYGQSAGFSRKSRCVSKHSRLFAGLSFNADHPQGMVILHRM